MPLPVSGVIDVYILQLFMKNLEEGRRIVVVVSAHQTGDLLTMLLTMRRQIVVKSFLIVLKRLSSSISH